MTVRSAVGVEIIWLLFGGVVFLSFRWMFLISGSCAQTSHTPAPLKRGDFGCCFLLGNEWFVSCMILLLRGGLRGVLW